MRLVNLDRKRSATLLALSKPPAKVADSTINECYTHNPPFGEDTRGNNCSNGLPATLKYVSICDI